MFAITPKDIEKEAISQGISCSELYVPPLVILTFSNYVLEELSKLCGLKDWTWAGSNFSPYAQPNKCLRGKIKNNHDIAVFFPPMGASPLAAFCEELIFFGAKVILLVCASWSLGEKYLKKGQIHLPSFAIGIDGTSPHYGNKNWKITNEPCAFKALSAVLKTLDVNWKEGGVGSCEAIYRITPELMDDFRMQGCISMENGEVAALYSLAKEHKLPIGVLLQPYIDLEKGWNSSYLDDTYKETCKIQALVAVEALKNLI